MSVNKVILIGTLGGDPDVKWLDGGKCMAKLSVATNENWKDKVTGEKKQDTQWHKIVLFGKIAEIADNYLNKGSKIYLEGQIKTRKYDKDGEDRYITEILGQQIQFLDTKNGGNKGDFSKPESKPSQENNSEYEFNDDIPF